MPVPVMYVGEVRMLVRQHSVPMWVHMRLVSFPWEVVLVLMVRAVLVAMCVLECLMRVLMFVPFPNVQPNAQTHKRRGNPEERGWRLGPKHQRNNHAEQRSHRKVGTRSGGAKRTQCHHKERQTQAIPEEANDHAGTECWDRR